MTRTLRETMVALPALLVAAAAPAASADFPAPQSGSFSPSDLDRVRAEAAAEVLSPDLDWENNEMMEEEQRELASRVLPPADDDTAHYKRGHTLILHVFINHTGGTWSTAEMDNAGAKGQNAKDLYLTNAPAAANVYFDHEGNSGYFFYNPALAYNIPTDGMSWAIADDAVAAIGFTDGDGDGSAVDDMTIWLQNWSGGWDNVILVFQPADITGRAFASYGHAKVIQYTDDTSNVWRHEWGHSFGACDEYVESGQCNGGINCGACQSTYLHAVQNNSNCQLVACPLDVPCVMIDNVSSICSATREHWAWVDDDSDGRLDICKRRDSTGALFDIYPLPQDTNWLWNSTTHGWHYSAMNNQWSVVGVRSPSTADYDIRVYGENSHNHLLASSAYGGQTVDFVVGDYNHSRLGDEFVQVVRFSGATDDYRINYDGNNSTTYPDGVVRSYGWNAAWAVRALDVPLFAGETVTFVLDITSGSLDLGMSLFRSNGAAYYAGRAGAQWTRDVGGVGVSESWTYTVPADDVYGLIIFSNSAATGNYTIQIGPTPATLTEETPFYSGLDLRLFNYGPNAGYWSFIGNRPDDPGNTTVKLFNESSYQTLLETSDNYNSGPPSNVDFIAVDYNHVSLATDYPRVIRVSGANHRTEWEHDADINSGVASETWASGHVGKVWDMFLTGGTNYFFREYHGSALDTGLYLFSSSDADYYKERAAFAAASNFRDASQGGEWFNYTPATNDWHGLYLIVNDNSTESYSIWAGPDVVMADDGAQTRSDEVVFASSALAQSAWHVFGARPGPADETHVWLYGDDAYTISTLAVSDQVDSPGDVNYVVGDYHHMPVGTVYPRYRRVTGTGSYTYELEAQTGEQVVWNGGAAVSADFSWTAGDVVETIEVWIADGLAAHIVVEDLSGVLDLGAELFDSNGAANYYRRAGQGVDASDVAGVGGTETLNYVATGSDWHGLIIYSNNAAGGLYRVTVGPRSGTDAPVVSVPTTFEVAAVPNPFRSAAEVRFALPRPDRVDVAIYDVSGRLVRQLVREDRPAGRHVVAWDGRDSSGLTVSAGTYLARIRTSGEEEILKITRVQ